jgi:arylsulfatase A-like enzyme
MRQLKVTVMHVATAAMISLFLLACSNSEEPEVGPPPNIVLIVTDDLDAASMFALPQTDALAAQGLAFSRAYATTPVCGPGRVSFLRGQYTHNHGVLRNETPRGGFPRFQDLGLELSTVGTWLQDAGYRTAFLGKYMNGYPSGEPTYVPTGWDLWFATLNRYFNYRVNEDGEILNFGAAEEDYETDVLSARAVDWIREVAQDTLSFFIYVNPRAPHKPATPAPRHAGVFGAEPLPRSPSFNEADVSDKPEPIRSLPLLADSTIADLEQLYRSRLETLLAVDELVVAIVDALAEEGIADETYVFFTSDNGFHMGEHRQPDGKSTAYEEDIHVPLIAWGPGVRPGVSEALALNIDIAPTIADLAGAPIPDFVDGQSLVPVFVSPGAEHRRDFMVEVFEPILDLVDPPGLSRSALRTADTLYAEWNSGDVELYDTRTDPYQLESQHGQADTEVLAELARRLADLRRCSGSSCRH